MFKARGRDGKNNRRCEILSSLGFFHERVELPGTLCLTVQSWDDIDSL